MNDKQQLAAMGEHLSEQLPMCMAKRIEELEAQVLVMAGLLRKTRPFVEREFCSAMECSDSEGDIGYLLCCVDDALSGKLPAPAVPEGWHLVGYRNHSAPNGLRRFMTPRQYGNQTDGIKKWYEPVYAAPVPEGWQLVPVKLTPEMNNAAFQSQGSQIDWCDIEAMYRGMLAAAPKPEAK